MRRISRRSLLKHCGIGSTFGLAGCLRFQSDNATQDNTDSVTNQINLSTAWEQSKPGSITGTGEYFYIATSGTDQRLIKIGQDGQTVFETSVLTGNSTYFDFNSWLTGLQVDDTGIYFGVQATSDGTSGGQLIRLDSETGEQIWETDEKVEYNKIVAPVRIENFVIYGAVKESEESIVRAVDIDSGELAWEFSNFSGHLFQLIVSGGEIWIQTPDSITRLGIQSRSIIDRISQIEPEYNLQSTISEGVVYVPSDPLTTLEFESGEERWSREGSINLNTDPTVGDTAVFYGTTSGYIRAFEKSTGDQMWERRVDGEVGNPMILYENMLWVGTSRGYLMAFEAGTGEPLYKSQIVTEAERDFSFTIQGDVLLDSVRTSAYSIRL